MEIKQIIEQIKRGTSEIINEEALEQKLTVSQKEGWPLRVKAGFDPTAPDIHLGHTVLLRKLRQFQDLGHIVDFIVGDFTALIGDPTGKNKLRPAIDGGYIRENAKTYTKQAFKILDPSKTNVYYNSQWLGKLSPEFLLALTAFSTVGQMLARQDFKTRYSEGNEISIMEFIYPLLQGFDSYVLGSDIELGGTDQKFNLLMGRHLQEVLFENKMFQVHVRSIFDEIRNNFDNFVKLHPESKADSFREFNPSKSPQVVIMTPLLEGTDGIKKMSKSLGNYIGIDESGDEMFGKLMSISDMLMMRYYELLTDSNLREIKNIHPKEAKMNLAVSIISDYHGKEKAITAKQNFENIFSKKQIPENIDEFVISDNEDILLVDVLLKSELVESKNEFRRLVRQGGVSVDGQKVVDEAIKIRPGVIKIGKRKFLKVVNLSEL